jgi:hypothetical protein
VLLVLRTPELSGIARRLPGGRRHLPVETTIAPEIAAADEVVQAAGGPEEIAAERHSPA